MKDASGFLVIDLYGNAHAACSVRYGTDSGRSRLILELISGSIVNIGLLMDHDDHKPMQEFIVGQLARGETIVDLRKKL